MHSWALTKKQTTDKHAFSGHHEQRATEESPKCRDVWKRSYQCADTVHHFLSTKISNPRLYKAMLHIVQRLRSCTMRVLH